jgi:hypothetical protein
VGSKTGLNSMQKRKISCPCSELNPSCKVVQPDWNIPAPLLWCRPPNVLNFNVRSPACSVHSNLPLADGGNEPFIDVKTHRLFCCNCWSKMLFCFIGELVLSVHTDALTSWRLLFESRNCWSKIKVKLCLYVNNSAPRYGDVSRSEDIVPLDLNLDPRWKWVVSFTPRPRYPRGKRATVPVV